MGNATYRPSACLTPPDAHVRASGELDLCTAPSLSRLLGGVMASGCRAERVDLASVTFIAASCPEVFVGIRQRMDDEGESLAFLALTSILRRVFALAGLNDVWSPSAVPESWRSRRHLSMTGRSS